MEQEKKPVTEPPAKEEKGKKIDPLYIFMGIGVVGAIVAATLYFNQFHTELSSKQEDWGTAGDYFGGMLNPFFSFLALLALMLTIRLQVKELKDNREVLTLTKEELVTTNKAHKAQLIQTKKTHKAQLDYWESQGFMDEAWKILNNIDHRLETLLNQTVNTLSNGRPITVLMHLKDPSDLHASFLEFPLNIPFQMVDDALWDLRINLEKLDSSSSTVRYYCEKYFQIVEKEIAKGFTQPDLLPFFEDHKTFQKG